jgi:uncharacterized protein (DUF1501 family)
MSISRRNFLKASSLASGSLLVPSFLKAFDGMPWDETAAGKVLVVVQFTGGNDGLNTVVPYRNDIYHKSRPDIGIKETDALRLNGELGLNPGMTGLKGLFDDGMLSIINNVGYPEPDHSHFRSMDIWQSGSGSENYWGTGWLGRYLDTACRDCGVPHHAVEISAQLGMALQGKREAGFSIRDLKKMVQLVKSRPFKMIQDHAASHHNETVAYLYQKMVDTISSAKYLHQQSKIFESNVKYPQDKFAYNLKMIAELIIAETTTKVYYLSLGSFDTHTNQRLRQDRLLQIYSDSMAAFMKDLRKNGKHKDVVVMTFSEFGRRVKQNGGKGTDHGTANNLFLIGGGLKKPGVFNAGPDLSKLNNGDLLYSVDFRRVYGEILNKWLGTDPFKILKGQFAPLDVL